MQNFIIVIYNFFLNKNKHFKYKIYQDKSVEFFNF